MSVRVLPLPFVRKLTKSWGGEDPCLWWGNFPRKIQNMIIIYPEILLSVAILGLVLYGLNAPAFKLSIGSLLIMAVMISFPF